MAVHVENRTIGITTDDGIEIEIAKLGTNPDSWRVRVLAGVDGIEPFTLVGSQAEAVTYVSSFVTLVGKAAVARNTAEARLDDVRDAAVDLTLPTGVVAP